MEQEIDINRQKRRERIGVVVFIIAIIGIFFAVFAYITASHSLDLSASDIDSNVGQLDGYLTLGFEGDNTPRAKKTTENDDILKIATDFITGETSDNAYKNNNESQNKENKINTEPATIENVRDFYHDKGSTFCSIKCSDYSAYTEGEVFERGFWKIGVLSVTQEYLTNALVEKKAQIQKEANQNGQASNSPLQDQTNVKEKNSYNSETSKSIATKTPCMLDLQRKITNLRKDNDVDVIIVLSPHQDIIDLIERVDCVICKNVYDDIPVTGKTINSVFTMRVPDVGSIGTILTTPAKMYSGHVYTKIEINEDE